MAEATLTAPPEQAIDAKPEQATEIGTPGDGVSVRQEDTGENQAKPEAPDSERAPAGDGGEDLLYSESTVTARIEAARAETADNVRAQERQNAKDERDRITRASNDALREHQQAKTDAWNRYQRDEITLEQYQQVDAQWKDRLTAHLSQSTADVYKREISAFLVEHGMSEKEADAFQDEHETGYVADVLRDALNRVSLKTDSVRKAKPEDLIAANPALKAHIAEHGDRRFGEGRAQGRKDAPGENRADGTPTPTSMTSARLYGLPPDEYETFKREHPDEYKRLVFGG